MSGRIIGLLLCVLLGVDLSLRLSSSGKSPLLREAMADTAAAGHVTMTMVQGPANTPWVCVYDAEAQRLATYSILGQGIELKGVRCLSWDLKLTDLTPNAQKRFTVKDAKEAAEKP